MKRPFTFSDGLTIDLDSVEAVSPPGSDQNWEQFLVYMKSGIIFNIHEETVGGYARRKMRFEDFLKVLNGDKNHTVVSQHYNDVGFKTSIKIQCTCTNDDMYMIQMGDLKDSIHHIRFCPRCGNPVTEYHDKNDR